MLFNGFFFQFELFFIAFNKQCKWPNKNLNNVIMPSNKQFFPLLQFNYLLNQYADLKYKYLPSPTSSSTLQKIIMKENDATALTSCLKLLFQEKSCQHSDIL